MSNYNRPLSREDIFGMFERLMYVFSFCAGVYIATAMFVLYRMMWGW